MKTLNTTLITLLFATPLFTLGNTRFDDSTAENGHGKSTAKSQKTTAVQWQKSDDQINGKFNKAQLTQLKSMTGSLHSFLQDSCFQNTNLVPIWHSEFAADKNANGLMFKF